jgi:hypothetical protein
MMIKGQDRPIAKFGGGYGQNTRAGAYIEQGPATLEWPPGRDLAKTKTRGGMMTRPETETWTKLDYRLVIAGAPAAPTRFDQ